MPETDANPMPKKSWRLAFRICAVACTILTFGCIGYLLSRGRFQKTVAAGTVSTQAAFLKSHNVYMAGEYPERGNGFWSMAVALREWVDETPLAEADLYRYLGRPDQFYATNVIDRPSGQRAITNKIIVLAYLFDRPGVTNKWCAVVELEQGKVQQIGFSDASQNERFGLRPYESTSGTASDSALQIWRSPDASLQQRAEAVTKLIPTGTSKEEVGRVLDKKGTWSHYHGLTIDGASNRQLPDHDDWRLVYDFPGGGVRLEFEPSTAFGDKFVRAEPFRRFVSIPLTNAP